MRWSRSLALIAVVLLACPSAASSFDVAAYRDYLEQIEDLGEVELIQSHGPYGPYREHVSAFPDDPLYLDPLREHFALSDDELALLRRNGFMVSERLAFESYGDALLELWHADLPVFVSSDLILHTVHRSFLQVLQAIETTYIIPELEQVLRAAHERLGELELTYGDAPHMRSCLDDLDVYVSVARTLLAGASVASLWPDNAPTVADLLAKIEARTPVEMMLFSEALRWVDFSQFEVRGYYTRREDLSRYFRCMMWLGRIDFRLSPVPADPQSEPRAREIVDAFLLRELMNLAQQREALASIDRIIRSFVGDPDNTTLADLDRLVEGIGLPRAGDLWNPRWMQALAQELAEGGYEPQAINSRILMIDPRDPDPVQLPFAFLLMGQRFIVDSHVFGSVVYDRIVFEGRKIFRGLPDPLDAIYCLGNDEALPLLREELERYHYAENLAALRYLIDGYDEEFWSQNLYNLWLHALRSLARTGQLAGAPEFMQTEAWAQEKIQTQLASWAELRHDTLLYAKQSYTGGVVCSYPYGYVEPIPEFFARLRSFAQVAGVRVGELGLSGGYVSLVQDFYARMDEIMAMLEGIARAELAQTPLDEGQIEFLQTVLFTEPSGCTDVESGWLRELYFEFSDWPSSRADRIIADVHTQPTDELGGMVGKVLHVGTGDPLLGVFVAALPEVGPVAFAGPVSSFHSHVTLDFARLTDEQWSDLYETGLRPRPDWTWPYLADSSGRVRQGGRTILGGALGIDDPEQPPPDEPPSGPTRIASVRNLPNPFNPRTIIAIELEGATSVDVRLEILDIRGRVVRVLLNEPLGARTHLIRWDGKDAVGRPVASGVYVARVVAGTRQASHKMVLLR